MLTFLRVFYRNKLFGKIKTVHFDFNQLSCCKYVFIIHLYITSQNVNTYLTLYCISRQGHFNTVGKSLIKIAVMTRDLTEFDTIFEGTESVQFPVPAYFLFVIFLIAMNILLMNMLVRHCSDITLINVTVTEIASLCVTITSFYSIVNVTSSISMWNYHAFDVTITVSQSMSLMMCCSMHRISYFNFTIR